VLRSAVDDLPLWLVLVVFVAAVLGLVLLLIWLVRRLVPAVAEGFDAEVASQMLGVVAALFGLLLAFIIVIAYQNYTDAQSNVTGEADALAAIVRDTGAFSQPERERVRASIGVYVRTVVDDEWPLLREGEDSPRASAAIDAVFTALQSVDAMQPSAAAFYDDSVRQLNAGLEALTAGLLVERVERLDVGGGHRTPERAPCERRHDLRGARGLFRNRRGTRRARTVG